jgi:hypothetical protein
MVGIPPLAMVDDLFLMAGCGLPSVLIDAFINAKTNTKKLQFGADKCHKLHVGKQCDVCPNLYIDKWKMEETEEVETGVTNLEEVLDEAHLMEMKDEDKYLGDIIMNNGKNTKNIKSRRDKGEGNVRQIMSILDDMCFGPFQFEVANTLRESLFINSILTNSEVWYNLTKVEIEQLEQIDEELLRKILETGRGTPKVMLYLEMGCLPIRYIVKKRRIMFLHYILHQENESLLQRVFYAQRTNPVRGDWFLTVKEDLRELEIDLSLEKISEMSESSLQKLLKSKVDGKALEFLNNGKKSKTSHISHKELQLQPYLRPGMETNLQKKFLFQLRARMIDLKANFQGSHSNLDFSLCEKHIDNQESLLSCEKLVSSGLVPNLPQYSDLFSKDVATQFRISSIFEEKFKLRKVY